MGGQIWQAHKVVFDRKLQVFPLKFSLPPDHAGHAATVCPYNEKVLFR